jgi:hypothetical protein
MPNLRTLLIRRNLVAVFSTLFLFGSIFFTAQITKNFSDPRSKAASSVHDLRDYYPNPSLYQTHYLDGFNHIDPSLPKKDVLWFEKIDEETFRMYNSSPLDPNSRCHYDQLSWWGDGYFRYVKTHHSCPGSIPNEVVYEPPIVFLPRTWDETASPWTLTNPVLASYYENGVLRCQGTNTYTARILGWEEIAPGARAIHWRTNQVTNWNSGDVPGKCFAGYVTNWQEDYWLLPEIPVEGGGVAKALKRTKGGNLETNADSWDVWFDQWKRLPNAPTTTPTAAPTPSTNQISDISVSGIRTDRATVAWTTSLPSDSQVIYGRNQNNLNSVSARNSTLKTSHSVTLSRLSRNTTYFYKVRSRDKSGKTIESTVRTFKTLANNVVVPL